MTTTSTDTPTGLLIVTHLFNDEASAIDAATHLTPAPLRIDLDPGSMTDADWDSLVAAMLAADKLITL